MWFWLITYYKNTMGFLVPGWKPKGSIKASPCVCNGLSRNPLQGFFRYLVWSWGKKYKKNIKFELFLFPIYIWLYYVINFALTSIMFLVVYHPQLWSQITPSPRTNLGGGEYHNNIINTHVYLTPSPRSIHALSYKSTIMKLHRLPVK